MRTTKATHFWTWFRRNQRHYLHYEKLAPAAKAYWIAELKAHVTAVDRHLRPFLGCNPEGVNKGCELVISAECRLKSFRAADGLIGKAPRLAGWNFLSLLPPTDIKAGMREELADAGLDSNSFWFDVRDTLTGRRPFYVFVDTRKKAPQDLDIMAEQAVANVLGERLYSERVECVYFVLILDILPENLAFLAPLDQLRDFLNARDLSGMVVGQNGKLVKK